MGLPRHLFQGGSHIVDGAGDPNLYDIVNLAAGGPTVAELKAMPPTKRIDGMRGRLSDGRRVRFKLSSTLTADGDQLVFVPDSGDGRWLVEVGSLVNLALAILFSQADAAVLYTMPTGSALQVRRPYWEITTPYSGGSSSAIGLSSSQAPHNTKGDLLGGAGGDVEATLVAGSYIPGTIGADIAAGVILVGGSTIRQDRITSAFTAGAGFAHVTGQLLAHPG